MYRVVEVFHSAALRASSGGDETEGSQPHQRMAPTGSLPAESHRYEGYSSTGSRLAKRSFATRSARDWNAVSTFSPVFALEKWNGES